MIPPVAFLTLLALAAAALALWADCRWPALRPGLSWRLGAHLATSTLLAQLSPLLLGLALRAGGRSAATITALLLIAYAFLAALWLLRALLERRPGGGHRVTA
jgi:hypothetical protein